jgi:organic radical activating enzyme
MATSLLLPVIEIFSSIQGEGAFAGQRHLFLRLHKCNLSCKSCDETSKKYDFLDCDTILSRINRLFDQIGHHNFISITGGEPLIWVKQLVILCDKLKERKSNLLLETNGTLAQELSLLQPYIDCISMDLKLSSVWHITDCYYLHKDFLDKADLKKIYIKIVISESTNYKEYWKYIELISSYCNSIPVYIHPFEDTTSLVTTSIETLKIYQSYALQILTDVRIAPRYHTVFNLK